MESTKSPCDFGNVAAKDASIMRKMLKLALLHAGENPNDNFEEMFTEFSTEMKQFYLTKDERKFLWLEYLELTNMPVEDLEARYLETIFDLEDENALAEHLTDFIENAQI